MEPCLLRLRRRLHGAYDDVVQHKPLGGHLRPRSRGLGPEPVARHVAGEVKAGDVCPPVCDAVHEEACSVAVDKERNLVPARRRRHPRTRGDSPELPASHGHGVTDVARAVAQRRHDEVRGVAAQRQDAPFAVAGGLHLPGIRPEGHVRRAGVEAHRVRKLNGRFRRVEKERPAVLVHALAGAALLRRDHDLRNLLRLGIDDAVALYKAWDRDLLGHSVGVAVRGREPVHLDRLVFLRRIDGVDDGWVRIARSRPIVVQIGVVVRAGLRQVDLAGD